MFTEDPVEDDVGIVGREKDRSESVDLRDSSELER